MRTMWSSSGSASLLLSSTLLLALPTSTIAKAILGVDLGSLYMKVALVQRNSPLEIVTNLHSKRKTEQLVLFDQGTRFYGADANSMVARKPMMTPAAMSVMLGRDDGHPTVQVLSERHYPLTPSYNETRSGVCLTIDGQDFTPEELVAMVLTHAKDITTAYGTGNVRDCVLTVPSFFTQHERRSLLDASALADLNVLALIDENTAAALHFGIDRIDEEPKTLVFYNMGASALQVSVVRYFSYEKKESKFSTKGKPVGAFEVLGKAWDSTLGGAAFDARIVDHMADEFNDMWNKKRGDGETKTVRDFPRAMAKLRVMAGKVKLTLSANVDFPIFIDALHDDTNYQSHIDRATFEQLCHDLLLRTTVPIRAALEAANVTADEVDMFELIGGGMRVPRVQEEIRKALKDDMELGMHINSDESMALGAAFHGANISTAFRVRHVGMADVNPFPIAITLNDLETDGDDEGEEKEEEAKKEDEDGADGDADKEVWSKHATLFKSNGKIGVKKTIAFTHNADVHCGVDYEESDSLPPGTEHSIERYNVTGIAAFAKEMAEKGLAKPKVSLQFEMSSSGLTTLIKAEAVVEENITITEEVEVDDDDEDVGAEDAKADGKAEDVKADDDKAEDAKADDKAEEAKEEGDDKKEEDAKEEGDDKKDDEAAAEATEGDDKKENETAAEPAKKKKTKTVEKKKKKVHRRPLTVKSYYVGRIRPYSEEIMAESVAKLQEMAARDKERMMLEEAKNRVESYIYHIKNKLIDDEEAVGKVTTAEQREAVQKLSEDAEEWMYEDGYDADLATFEEKYAELSTPMEKIKFRISEIEARPIAVAALRKKLGKIDELMTKWEMTMPQVTEEERAGILAQVEEIKKRISDSEEKQAAADPSEDPVFISADVPLETKDVEVAIATLSKKPKPKPVVEEKKNDTDAEKVEGESDEAQTEGEEKKEEGEAGDAESSGAEGKEEAGADETPEAEKEEAKADDEL